MRRAAVTVVAALGLAGCSPPASTPAPTQTQAPAPPSGATAARTAFWVDPDSEAARRAAAEPAFLPIAREPTALTLAGGDAELRALDRAVAGARAARQTLVVQVYDVPQRDAGSGFSAGGADSPDQYRAYTRAVAQALRGAPRVLLVLEPDALAQADRLPVAQQDTRYALLADAVEVYRAVPGVRVYLDGGNSGWTPVPEMARRLRRAGVARARGFAVNVSNVHPTADEARRAERLSAHTGGAHYVVDTSRNGGGDPPRTGSPAPTAPWCNPSGTRLGQRPTTQTGYPHADALLWVKHPGLSDGACAPGQPPAGAWYDAYARQLVGLPAAPAQAAR